MSILAPLAISMPSPAATPPSSGNSGNNGSSGNDGGDGFARMLDQASPVRSGDTPAPSDAGPRDGTPTRSAADNGSTAPGEPATQAGSTGSPASGTKPRTGSAAATSGNTGAARAAVRQQAQATATAQDLAALDNALPGSLLDSLAAAGTDGPAVDDAAAVLPDAGSLLPGSLQPVDPNAALDARSLLAAWPGQIAATALPADAASQRAQLAQAAQADGAAALDAASGRVPGAGDTTGRFDTHATFGRAWAGSTGAPLAAAGATAAGGLQAPGAGRMAGAADASDASTSAAATADETGLSGTAAVSAAEAAGAGLLPAAMAMHAVRGASATATAATKAAAPANSIQAAASVVATPALAGAGRPAEEAAAASMAVATTPTASGARREATGPATAAGNRPADTSEATPTLRTGIRSEAAQGGDAGSDNGRDGSGKGAAGGEATALRSPQADVRNATAAAAAPLAALAQARSADATATRTGSSEEAGNRGVDAVGSAGTLPAGALSWVAPGSGLAGASAPAPTDGRIAASPGSPEFAPQLAAQVTTFVRDGVQHAKLELNPADMGPLTVQIQLDGNAARVHLAAENAQTRQALEQAMPQLAGSLREGGLTLSGGGVFEQPRQPQQQAQQQTQQQAQGGDAGGNRLADSGGTAGDARVSSLPAGPVRRQSGVVDLVA